MSKNKTALPRPRRRLSDLRLRNRLILLVLLPLIASVALATARVVTEMDAIQAEGNLNGQVQVAQSVSRLVHAMQDERDLIALYLTNGQRASDMSTLATAESGTASQVQAFEAELAQQAGSINALSPSARALAVQAEARLGDLPVLRTSVVSLGDTRPVFQAYTTVISTLLNFSHQLATGTTDRTLANLVITLSLVEQAGEQTSEERGFLVGILGNGGQIREQQEDLIQAQANYTNSFATFSAQAPPQTVSLFDSTVSGQDTGNTNSTVQQIIDAALEQHPVSSIGVSDTAAFSAASTKVSQIRSVEGQLNAQSVSRTSFLLSAARTQLYLNAAIVVLTLLLAFLATVVVARSIVEPLRVLRTSAYQIATISLPEVIRRLRDASDVESPTHVAPIDVDSADEIGEVARAFDEVHQAAVRLASEQALLRNNVNSIFKNLSRRSQGLVERQLRLIDALENSERDPGQLAQLFKLDHLATRMRRNNENLLVLAGEETARRWTDAVRLVDVARAAAAEVEQYERIMFGEIPRTRIIGKAAPDVAHLVAELLENATTYSAPQTKVWVAARAAQDGGVILHIEDVGIGMTAADIARANERLASPPVVDVGVSRQMGLFVVGRLAARYSISVRLSESQAGGVTASIHVPVSLVDISRLTGQRSGGPEAERYPTVPEFVQGARPAELGWNGEPEPAPWADRGAQHAPGMNGNSRPRPEEAGFIAARDTGPQDEGSWFDYAPGPAAARSPQTAPDGRQQAPPPPPAPRPTDPPQADPDDRLPIFEAVESEWFRRRGQRPPHIARSPRAAQPWDTWSAGGDPPGVPAQRTDRAQSPTGAGPVPARALVDAAPPPTWASPGDEGWRAAEALAHPTLNGTTPTGLPRRVPKANLVPGKAGGTGAARATPPPSLIPTAEAVRKRLSTFRRNTRTGFGEADES